MKRFLLKLLRFVPIILIVILINLLVDPARIFSRGVEGPVAFLLVDGNAVHVDGNLDERQLQSKIVLLMKTVPNTIMMGSSRSMPVNTAVVGEKAGRFFNHAVSGAGIYDYMGIVGLYIEKGELPARIVLGLDPWILNENNGDTRFTGLNDGILVYTNAVYSDSSGKQGPKKEWLNSKYAEILSPAYLQSAIKQLFSNGTSGESGSFYALSAEDDGGILSDGSRIDTAEILATTAEESDRAAKQYCREASAYQLNDYRCLSDKYETLLEDLVVWLLNQNVQVCFYLPPYHPIVYTDFCRIAGFEMVQASERYFRTLASEYDIDVYGSYNPVLFDGLSADFSDGMHIKSTRIGKFWGIRQLP